MLGNVWNVSHDLKSFSCCRKVWEQIGLCWHSVSYHREFHSELVLWILLSPTSTRCLLDNGELETYSCKLLCTDFSLICSLGLACASVSIFERFRTPAWRPYRASMFVALGLSAVIPILHGIQMYGVQAMRARIGLTWLVLQGLLYILGAGLYAVRTYSTLYF